MELTDALRERLTELYARFTFDIVAREAFDHLHFGLWRELPADSNHFARAQQIYADAVVGLIPESAKRVLDVGCGLGSIARQLSERGHDVIAVTPRADHVAAIQRAGVGAFELRCARFEELEPDTEVDVVLFAESFNFLAAEASRVPALLERCARWLRPGGHVLAADWLSNTVAEACVQASSFEQRRCDDITDDVTFTFDVLQERFERVARPYHELVLAVLDATDEQLAAAVKRNLDAVPSQALRSVFAGSLADRDMARDRRYLMLLLQHQPQSHSTSSS